MKGGNEHKNNIAHRLRNSLDKPLQEDGKVRSKHSGHKFTYQLPKSFFNAVDDARVEAGYDVLPRLHRLSVSPSPSSSSHHQQAASSPSNGQSKKHHHGHRENGHASSASDTDNIASKKVRFRRTNHKHSHHHHHREKNIVESSPGLPIPRKLPSNAFHRSSSSIKSASSNPSSDD